MRGERTGCMWAPLGGSRRLLYDCVWLVSASQSRPQILLRVSLAPLAVSLHCRSRLANCASPEARFLSPGLVGCKSRKHKSGGGLRAQASCAASAISHTLANLTTWRLPRGRLRIVIWLILPVVICLSQRLSHACLSINGLYSETANGSLNQL